MKEQNFKNHSKWVIGYHGITLIGILAFLVGSIINFLKSSEDNLYSASLLVLLGFILVFMFYFTRSFALRAQDRAISAEEKLRYYILTGKSISNKLTTRQFVGLRFASDEEFPALADKAAMENLAENDIKKAIINWKADEYRV
jgi:membrane-bound ClpP family serine protease